MNATPAIRYSADELAADLAGRTATLLGDVGAGLPGDVLGYAVARVSGGQVVPDLGERPEPRRSRVRGRAVEAGLPRRRRRVRDPEGDVRAAWAVTAVAAACTVAAVSLAGAGLYLPGAVAGVVSLVVLGAGSGTFAAAVRERWRQLPRKARDDKVLNGKRGPG